MSGLAEVAIAAGAAADTPYLLVACCTGDPPPPLSWAPGQAEAIAELAERPGWSGRQGQAVETATPDGTVVSLLGVGQSGELTTTRFVRALLRRLTALRTNGVRRLSLVLPAHAETGAGAAERLLTQLALAGYRFDRFKSRDSRRDSLEHVEVVPPAAALDAYRQAAAATSTVARAVAFGRDLANMPANEASPAWMEEQVRALATARGFELTVLGVEELTRRGMGGILAVGRGSATPPRLLRVRQPAPGRPRLALVGKGVTFDTGGISIKPAANLDQMKFDKCGACDVLAALSGAADLGLDLDLSVYVPVAENMLSAAAYRPGDIVRCGNGTTVEITNTDAEGRMILADALTWAAEDRPEALVELSTLTGACVVALGHQAAGLFSPDDGLAGELLAASGRSGERLWRLPLYPEYLDEMRSHHADLRNSADRWGAASNAAAFLSQFMGEIKSWAHLDIAGVAHLSAEDRHGSRATGFGIACLLSWLRHRAGTP